MKLLLLLATASLVLAAGTKREKRQINKVNKSLKKLKEAGIDYDFKITKKSG